ncbi:MAG TPA: PEP/pyruvate-binding domain-containing protein [bacterium]|nr:PEP/pyruvate-binding domain-containing protein [bacterium]
MTQIDSQLSTGLPGLDNTLRGLIPGDNIVWRADTLEDYEFFLAPYWQSARAKGRKVVYFRFGSHRPLVPEDSGVDIVRPALEAGFEKFISDLHAVIRENGRGAFYIFDSLTDLSERWHSDQMLGNMFVLICPYLLDVEAIAYFALLRGRNSSDVIQRIHNTAQVIINVFRQSGELYLHPLKVQRRYSPTMYMLHVWDGSGFQPVTNSASISDVMMSAPGVNPGENEAALGDLERIYAEAKEINDAVKRGERPESDAADALSKLAGITISRDARVLELARSCLTLSDVLQIKSRMIGSGQIGGKSVGMLISRAILRKQGGRWPDLLEAHDSFYVGSDVFYSFIVHNGLWHIREKQKDPERFMEGAGQARRRMLVGQFPDSIIKQFADMLDYFGQSPIIVRSSSLLEDNYLNAFSGKYESVFCANQGPREKRLEDFISAALSIYASSMSEKALSYRARRGLLQQDEQMALLVQRVSGSFHNRLFFPHIAGVGYSHNPYVWDKRIVPEAGMLRLVFGLGTRAVDRVDDDYTRIVALNMPGMRPESSFDKVRKYAQRRADVIDLDSNQLVFMSFEKIANRCEDIPLEMVSSRDSETDRRAAAAGMKNVSSRALTFNKLLKETSFADDMREMMSILREAYGADVDIEFTGNFTDDGALRINLLQCRPLNIKGVGEVAETPVIPVENLIMKSTGAVIGKSRDINIDWIIYVPPSVYGELPRSDRYAAARLIGKIARLPQLKSGGNIMMIGPGRWGSSMPELGLPVSFTEINAASVICELVAMNDNLIPEVSLGTHFFNDLVEMDILYIAYFPNVEGNLFNAQALESARNMLEELLPEDSSMSRAVKLIEARSLFNRPIKLNANVMEQKTSLYADIARE